MVLIELYGRAVWGSCMEELYGGAVWWSCILELYVKNIRYVFYFLTGYKPVPLLYDLGPRNMPYSRGLTSRNN